MKWKIDKDWRNHLEDALSSDYFKNLSNFIEKEYRTKKIYPASKDIFRALELAPLEDVKVVIIGQDPYPKAGESNGLAFSVTTGVKIPASLRNIFKEIELEYGKKSEAESKYEGDLTCWAKQGVLLLNTILTVEEGSPGSHKNMGWEKFTDEIIKIISKKGGVVFMLWGARAKNKLGLIDQSKNLVLTSIHPSQPSRSDVFAGNNHFIEANDWLKKNGKEEVVW